MVQQRGEPCFLVLLRATGARDPAHLTRHSRLCVRYAFCWPRSPWPAAFPPPPPPPAPRRCSAASQVLRSRLTSHGRSSRAYRLSVPLTTRHPPTCHPASHPGRGIIDNSHGRPRDLPVLANRASCMPGVSGPRGAPRQLAITLPTMSPSALHDGVGTPMPLISRLNNPACTTPTDASPTPSRTPTHDSGPPRVATPSSVGLFHPLLCSGSSRRSIEHMFALAVRRHKRQAKARLAPSAKPRESPSQRSVACPMAREPGVRSVDAHNPRGTRK